MRFSLGARGAIAAILLVSIGTKAALSRPTPGTGATDFSTNAARALSAQGFAASIEVRPFASIVHASKAGCRMILAEIGAHGTIAEPLTALSRTTGPLRFMWQGAVTETPPKVVPLAQFYARRELRRIGFRPDHLPIIAYAESTACAAAAFDWERLSALPV